MAWTAPRTYTTDEVIDKTILDTHVRDNLLETAPAKVAASGDLVEATAANAIAATQTPMATMVQAIIYG